jgi:dTDP-N-acetylfucosamine:lipid II N-acetylfucosaminyltransferase
MPKTKIIHIHSDLKFLFDSQRFVNNNFENIIIVIGDKKKYKDQYNGTVLFFNFSARNIRTIISYCKTADMVVLYDLNFSKAYIANRLPNSIKVVWRFFGLELYGKMPEVVFSEQTIRASKEISVKYDYLFFRNLLGRAFNKIRFGTNSKTEFKKAAFNRVDYFHGLSEKEYDFLKEFWPQLPPFLQKDYSNLKGNNESNREINYYHKSENNLIILGNNRSAYNNHLDLLDLIKDSNSKNKYKFLMFFNYGRNNYYADLVRNKANKIEEIEVLEDFLEIEKFNQIYFEASALVINGYRQMAMGNIFTAIKNKTKIYLSTNNVIFNWLKEEGFSVFSIEEFVIDLDNNNIALKEFEILRNQNQLVTFTKKYNQEEFHNSLSLILNEKTK